MDKDFKEIVLYELRENRKAIARLDTKITALDKDIFSNKIKLSIFIAGVTIFFNIIVIVIADKLKTFLT